MKKILLGALCLSLIAYLTGRHYYQKNCFVTQTEVTADMQKIHSIFKNGFKEAFDEELGYKLKYTEIACRLFGKNNNQLREEFIELDGIRQNQYNSKENEIRFEDFKKSPKGLKLDYSQILPLAKKFHKDVAEIISKSDEKFAPYKPRALEIVKAIEDQTEKKIDEEFAAMIHSDMVDYVLSYHIYDHYCSGYYLGAIGWLAKFISDGTLVDSFLEKHPSNSLLKIERSFNPYYLQSLIHSLYTVFLPVKNSISKNGETIFDVVRNAASSETISKKELSHLVGSTSSYMKDITLIIIDIQRGVTDKIDYPPLLNFYKEHKEPQYYLYSEYDITGLIDKYPKSEDFEREVNKLLPRIAYQTYHEINIAKFLYKEWRETYYSQVKELFANAVIIADKLYETMKDEVLPDNPEDSRRYAYKNTMQYILDIKEIAKIGVDKILTSADCYIDSQEEIKASLYKSFMETRKAHLKKLEK